MRIVINNITVTHDALITVGPVTAMLSIGPLEIHPRRAVDDDAHTGNLLLQFHIYFFFNSMTTYLSNETCSPASLLNLVNKFSNASLAIIRPMLLPLV